MRRDAVRLEGGAGSVCAMSSVVVVVVVAALARSMIQSEMGAWNCDWYEEDEFWLRVCVIASRWG